MDERDVAGPVVLSTAPDDEPAAAWVLVALRGDLDIGAVRALGVLGATVRAHPGSHVLVDLSEVTFVGSTALTAFAGARMWAAATRGVVTFHGAGPFIQRLLEVWHLEPTAARPSGPARSGGSSRPRLVVPRPRGVS